eukprot:tig00000144_g9006.t1
MAEPPRASSVFGFIRASDAPPASLRRARSDQLSTLREIELAEAKKRRHEFVQNPYHRELSASEVALRNRQLRNAALHRKTRLAYMSTTMDLLDQTDVVKRLPPAAGRPPRAPRAEGPPAAGAGREHFNTVLLSDVRSEADSEDEEAGDEEGKLPPKGRSLSAPGELKALRGPAEAGPLVAGAGVEIAALERLGQKLDLVNARRIVPVSYGAMDELMSEARLSFPSFEAALRALRAHCGCEEHVVPIEAQWARYEGLFERLAAVAHASCERANDAVARARRRRKEAEAAVGRCGRPPLPQRVARAISRARAPGACARPAEARRRAEAAARDGQRAGEEAARAAREEVAQLRAENEALKRLAYSNSFAQWRREREEAGLARPPSSYLPDNRVLPPPVVPPAGPPSTLVNVRNRRTVTRRVKKRRPPPAPQTRENVAFFLTQDKEQAAEAEEEWTEEEVEEEVVEDLLEQRPAQAGPRGPGREPPRPDTEGPSSTDMHRAALSMKNRFAEEREAAGREEGRGERAAAERELLEILAKDETAFDAARALREFDPETLEALRASRARAGDVPEQQTLEVAVQESEEALDALGAAEGEREELLKTTAILVRGLSQHESLQRYGRLAETLLKLKAQLAEKAAQLAERAAELDFRSRAPKDIEGLIAWKRSRKERAAAGHGAHGEHDGEGRPAPPPAPDGLQRMLETIRSTTEAEALAAEAAAAAAAGEEEEEAAAQAEAADAPPAPRRLRRRPLRLFPTSNSRSRAGPARARRAGRRRRGRRRGRGREGVEALAAEREKSLRRVEEVVIKAAHLLRKGFKMKEKDAKEKAKPVAVLALVDDVYAAKLAEDRKAGRGRRVPLADFLLEHLTATYGLRPMAEKQFLMVLATVIAMGDQSPKIAQFGRMLKGYSQPAQDFFLEAYEFLRGPAASVGPPLPAGDGDVDWAPLSRLEHTVRAFFSYLSMETVQHILAEVRAHAVPITPEEKKAAKHPALASETHKADAHAFLGTIVGHWAEENERRRKWLQQLFREGDLNRDGVLQYGEFRDIVRRVDPQADERSLQRLFADATAIPEERFADIMQRLGLLAWRRSAAAAAPAAASPPPAPAVSRSPGASPPRSPVKDTRK